MALIKRTKIEALEDALNFALVYFKKTNTCSIELHELFLLKKSNLAKRTVDSYYELIESKFVINNKPLFKNFFYYYSYEILKFEFLTKKSHKLFTENPYTSANKDEINSLKRDYYNSFIDELQKLELKHRYNNFLMDFLEIIK
ncbi:hypothetical protein [Mycoplasma crocodyli]|uniref:Uncharacterized protein n=1 Tax=Mycoplasma crocodyli (strain ATCC 51981 / MP145) TaxID=512564 RepID=D5E5F6_MYCCM|nr:hypothetical protein [Mycoplasma crocodyli]ADE20016.1 hypothetical protein MCRO_0361 [Mycoplasma crocodyli MP145]